MTHLVEPLGPDELHDVLNYAPVGVLVEDCGGRVVWLNHTLEWQLGVSCDSVVGAPTSELPLEPLPGARGKRIFRAPYAHGTGCVRHLKCIEDILPEYSETGIRVRYFLEASEEHPRQYRNDLLRLLESRPPLDPVTGLRDQEEIIQTLRTEVSRSRRYGNPLTVVVVRIVPRPQSGRVLHHPCKILAAAAGVLKNDVRWADSVGRCDEWEFLLVLPETSSVSATLLVQKLEERLLSTEDGTVSLRFDAGFGVAEWHRGDDEGTLLRRAQHAAGVEVARS